MSLSPTIEISHRSEPLVVIPHPITHQLLTIANNSSNDSD